MRAAAKRPKPASRPALATSVREACSLLSRRGCGWSARDPGPARWLALGLGSGLALLLVLGACGPAGGMLATAGAGLFLLTAAGRLVAALTPGPEPACGRLDVGQSPDGPVPFISILVALHREVDVLPDLLEALDRLHWPSGRRETVLIVEEDDGLTRDALAALAPHHRFRLLVIPDAGGPQTKPRALQAALPFTRGTLISVYDAEDRPHPRQLLAAAGAFARARPQDRLGVVQAPLVAEPDRDSWIGHQFALDYAVWFRVVLPFLSRWSDLLPLGGTSNHFRRDALEETGGWDPWNLTEDADLGIRLARHGWRARLIAPPTLEEAPPRLGVWLRQRTRWIQGHLQTLSVHLRRPQACLSDLGAPAALAMIAGIALGPAAALARLVMLMALPAMTQAADGPALLACLGGMGCEVLAAMLAIDRDGRRRLLLPALAGVIPYLLLQSLAAVLALRALLVAPHRWSKTEHGLRARAAPSGGAVRT